MSPFSVFEFRNQPWFDQDQFQGFDQAIAMKSIVVYCFDPRASEIPKAIADYFGNEVYPGENILDTDGNRVGHTRTLFPLTNAGGRALGAIQSIATMDYLFKKFDTVIVVHHSFCGATAFRPEQLVAEFHDHHHVDISGMFGSEENLAIMDFEQSIRYDVELLRDSPAVPKNIKLYGFFFDINSGKLTEVVRDLPGDRDRG